MLEEIEAVAAAFLQQLGSRKVVALHGNLGAGKTTFVRAVCKQLQVSTAVSSPTFSIINEYRTAQACIYHIDLYRLKDEREALRAGVEDCLYSGDLCLVEWPERAPDIFPGETVHVHLQEADQFSRRMVISDK